MTFEIFKQLVSKIEKMSLPGDMSHQIMAPSFRKKDIKLTYKKDNYRNAAVLIVCYPKNEIVHFALILRPKYKGVHSGQVAIPGGKVEAEDENFQATALRETWEEIGIVPHDIKIIRSLTKIYVPPSRFWVFPFLGMLEDKKPFVIQSSEVAEVIEISIDALLDETNLSSKEISIKNKQKVDVPCYKLKDYTVWGATAMILSELKVMLKQVLVI